MNDSSPGFDPRLAEYLRLRTVRRALQDRLVLALPREVLVWSAASIDRLGEEGFTFANQHETHVAIDHALFDHTMDGRNAIERALASGAIIDPEECEVLESMTRDRFSVFEVLSTTHGVGMHVRDVLRRDELFLCDVGLSESLRPGEALAGRVVPWQGFWSFTGAALPLTGFGLARTLAAVMAAGLNTVAPGREYIATLATTVLRTALAQGAGARIEAREVTTARGHGASTVRSAARVGRNDPCPCGSGTKFKKCHGR